MRRYVSVRYAPSKTVVTVTLVDGDLSAKWSLTSYLGNIGAATKAAEKHALAALEEVRVALEPS